MDEETEQPRVVRAFATVNSHLVRWEEGESAAAQETEPPGPSALEILTSEGWYPAGPGLRWLLLRRGLRRVTGASAERRRLRACSATAACADPQPKPSPALRLRMSLLVWWLSPPLGMGAPRFIIAADAQESFRSGLGDAVTPLLAEQAAAGYELGRDRLRGIEQRAGTFLQAAGLTSTLVLANSALLVGDDRVKGTLAAVTIVALLLASVALLAAGLYAMAAVMLTFDRIAPNSITRLVDRSRFDDENGALRHSVASLLLAQRRTSMVADWKLARLKRAAIAFLITTAGIAVASVALVLHAIG